MPVTSELSDRDRHIFARLLDGMSIRDIAGAEKLSPRRVQQIVAKEIGRHDINPAREYQLLQIARLERALDLLGAQIDAGKASAVTAFVRVMEMLNRLTDEQLHLPSAAFRAAGDVAKMEDRLGRLAAAREVLTEKSAKRNAVQDVEIAPNGETADFTGV